KRVPSSVARYGSGANMNDYAEAYREKHGLVKYEPLEPTVPAAGHQAPAPNGSDGDVAGDVSDGLAGWRIDWPKFWAQERTDADFLVEPVLARGRGHALVAPAKVGKTLLLQEIALALGTGRPILYRPASDPLTVVYLDMEMLEDDLYERATDLGYGPET